MMYGRILDCLGSMRKNSDKIRRNPKTNPLRFEVLEERALLSVTPGILPDLVQTSQEPDLETAMRLSEAQSTEEILSILGQEMPTIPEISAVPQGVTTLAAETDFDLTECRDYSALVANQDIQNGTITVTTLSDFTDATDGQITLREAIAYAGTNNLGTLIQFDCSGTITLNGTELSIDKSLTIVGENNIEISANQQSRVLSVAKNKDVNLSGLTFKNGKVDGKGGGIYNEGNLTLTESAIKNNTVSYVASSDGDGNPIAIAYGGGIYNAGAMTVINCTVSENSANILAKENLFDTSLAYGGGIYNADVMTLIDCTISKNSTNTVIEKVQRITVSPDVWACGGGVFNLSTITITNCFVSGNFTNSEFRSIYARNGDAVFATTAAGGGIYNMGSMTMVNCDISVNSANAGIYAFNCDASWWGWSEVDALALGGGIYNGGEFFCLCGFDITNVTLTMVNCTISGNSVCADNNTGDYGAISADSIAEGGGICNCEWYSDLDNSCTIIMIGCAILENFANGDSLGGGISNEYGTMVIINCAISGNSAYGYANGGGICNYGIMTMVNCTISGNSADSYFFSYAYAEGGGVWDCGTMTMINCTISGNSANADADADAYAFGGGIYGSDSTYIVNSQISGNSVSARGNGKTNAEGNNIYGDVNYTLPPDFTLPDITIAVLTPVTEQLSKTGTLTLDASNSYGASAYWWDLNSDETYDYVTQTPYLTLCGEDYSEAISGDMISWEELESLGYSSGDKLDVTLATATASGAMSLNQQTSNIKIKTAALKSFSMDTMAASSTNPFGLTTLLNVSFAVGNVSTEEGSYSIQDFAKQCAYNTTYKINDTVEGEDGHTYELQKIITNNQEYGLYAQFWVPTDSEGAPAILTIRGTVKDWQSIMSDTNFEGVGHEDFEECQADLLEYLKTTDRKVHITGHSLGGGQAQRLAAYATSQGIVLDGVTTYNSPGISNEEAKLFVSRNGGSVHHYIVEGDVVSLAGEAFIEGTNTLYQVSGLNKHSGAQKNYIYTGSDYISGSNHNISTADLNSPFFHYKWSVNTSLTNMVGLLSATNFRCTAEFLRKRVGITVDTMSDATCVVKALIPLKPTGGETITQLTLKKSLSGEIEVLGSLSLNGNDDCCLNVNLDVSQGYLTGMTLNETLDHSISKDIGLMNVKGSTITNFKV
ncbi:MAG: hypothetical protein Q4D98_08760, partial [Planctomycetia bacterium]|nr:hypothetical protein [Planctomycetia bacterium]